MHYLLTESPVEALCSIIRSIYRADRGDLHGLKLKKLVLLTQWLPNDDENRTNTVHWISSICEID